MVQALAKDTPRATFYRAAVGLLYSGGWIQRAWENDDGRCLVAALNRVRGEQVTCDLPNWLIDPIHQALMAGSASYRVHHSKHNGNYSRTQLLWTWNDARTTNFGDVIFALNMAAHDSEERTRARTWRKRRRLDAVDIELQQLLEDDTGGGECTQTGQKELVTV